MFHQLFLEKEAEARIGEETQEFKDHLEGAFQYKIIIESEGGVISTEDIGLEEFSKDARESSNEELADRIDKMSQSQGLSSECCIYRVPVTLRKLNKEAYSPRVISIGPFHYGIERLSSMEAVKMRCFKKLVERSRTRLGKYVELVKGFEGRARECYAETIGMDSNKFVSLLLIDACFIIELLLRSYRSDWNKEDAHVLSTPWLNSDIQLDLMLLENQIPFFILEEVFDLATISIEVPCLQNLTLYFFQHYNIHKVGNFKSVNHFTDLIMSMSRPRFKKHSRGQVDSKNFEFLYSATELHQAGVKFQVDSSSNCLLDVDFNRGVLKMSCFRLEDDTETFIRNLMALELCHYPKNTYIIDCIVFMDDLINTSKDVDLLTKKGILVNWLSDSNVAANLINNLCINIEFDAKNFFFSDICENLNAYYKVPMHKWKATLRCDYLSTVLKIASTVAAVTMLVLTLIQTICSILFLAI
ncbi:hypothetical protein LguiB_027656 [Lonicera macranthoides]